MKSDLVDLEEVEAELDKSIEQIKGIDFLQAVAQEQQKRKNMRPTMLDLSPEELLEKGEISKQLYEMTKMRIHVKELTALNEAAQVYSKTGDVKKALKTYCKTRRVYGIEFDYKDCKVAKCAGSRYHIVKDPKEKMEDGRMSAQDSPFIVDGIRYVPEELEGCELRAFEVMLKGFTKFKTGSESKAEINGETYTRRELTMATGRTIND